MTGTNTDREGDAGPTYRMSELVEASGVSRDMIKYYLRTGLLPPALKPRANLSHYTFEHLQLIGLIRKFQDQTKLSLQQIAELFKSVGFDRSSIEIEFLSARHSLDDDSNIIPLHSGQKSATGPALPAAFRDELREAALLEPSAENEQQIAGLLWAAREAGVPLSFFKSVKAKLAELADLEVKTLIAIKRPELTFSETMDNVTDVDRIINRWMITEKTGRSGASSSAFWIISNAQPLPLSRLSTNPVSCFANAIGWMSAWRN